MKSIQRIIVYSLLLVGSYFPTQPIQAQTLAPQFKDSGRTIDSLKTTYGAETISYDQWEFEHPDPTCLNILLINCKQVLNRVDATAGFMKIASVIKHALVDPKIYKSIYIIFVTINKVNGMNVKLHTAGMQVLMTEL
jgi:hypothetical protein